MKTGKMVTRKKKSLYLQTNKYNYNIYSWKNMSVAKKDKQR